MNPISQARADLAEAVGEFAAGDYFVTDHVPETVNLPAVILQPADPYVVPGETYGDDKRLELEAVLIPEEQTNEAAGDAVDAMLCDLLPIFDDLDWQTENAGPPRVVTANGWALFGSVVPISKYVPITPNPA